jgi:hypothetical protein
LFIVQRSEPQLALVSRNTFAVETVTNARHTVARWVHAKSVFLDICTNTHGHYDLLTDVRSPETWP